MEHNRPDMPPKGPPRGTPPCPPELLEKISIKYLDQAYCADSDAQKVDIYLPEDPQGPVPVICWFHGGGFQMGYKRDGQIRDLLPVLGRGYALVSVGYRKSGEARFPAMVYDAKAAIRFLRANGAKYGLDSSRIAVWGGSSGGWLASFVAATNGNSAFDDRRMGNAEVSSEVQALVDWCGPCGDFSALDKEKKAGPGFPGGPGGPGFPGGPGGLGGPGGPGGPGGSPEDAFMGAPVSTLVELCHLASPATHVSDKMPPTLIVHGGKDFVVPISQSETFHQAIVGAAGPERVQFHIHPDGGHHGDMWYHEPWLADLCLDFLDKHLK